MKKTKDEVYKIINQLQSKDITDDLCIIKNIRVEEIVKNLCINDVFPFHRACYDKYISSTRDKFARIINLMFFDANTENKNLGIYSLILTSKMFLDTVREYSDVHIFTHENSEDVFLNVEAHNYYNSFCVCVNLTDPEDDVLLYLQRPNERQSRNCYIKPNQKIKNIQCKEFKYLRITKDTFKELNAFNDVDYSSFYKMVYLLHLALLNTTYTNCLGNSDEVTLELTDIVFKNIYATIKSYDNTEIVSDIHFHKDENDENYGIYRLNRELVTVNLYVDEQPQ